MADIQLRFGKDMLVIGAPVWEQLANVPAFADEDLAPAADGLEKLAGVTLIEAPEDAAFDTELALLMEPEVFEDAFALEKAAGAQCLVAPTANLTPARLAHTGMRDDAPALARAAMEVAQAPTPEHVLVELAPCGLPLDASSKASLNENRQQYERAARLFQDMTFDAFFLNGFTRTADLKCALMGIRKVSDAPILASVDVDAEGMLRSITPEVHAAPARERLEDAVAVMAEYGANAAGFCTAAGTEAAAVLAERVVNSVYLPVLVQLFIGAGSQKLAEPDDVYDAALALAQAGVQFVRAAGAAGPACTGAMAAAVTGLDVGAGSQAPAAPAASFASSLDPDQLAARLRQSVNSALGIGETE